MSISKYYLSDYAKECLFNRHKLIGPPMVTSIGNTKICEPSNPSDSLMKISDESEFIKDRVLDSRFIKLQNNLIIGFEVDESMFNEQYNALLIDFKDCSENSRTPIRVFIDNISLYNGITERTQTESIRVLREKYGQLKLGYNTLIFENIFSCNFLFDEVLDNDLPNELTIDEGYNEESSSMITHIQKLKSVPLNSINELKFVYPYYKNI